MLRSNRQADSWQSITDTLIQPAFPAYPIESEEMRPVTKISIFGFRLAVTVLAAYWLAIFVGTHLSSVGDIAPKVSDKTMHFTAFFGLGSLMCYVTTSPRWFRRFTTIGLVGMSYAAIDEWSQQFVSGRHPDPWDFVADSAGLWSAIGIYLAAKLIFRAVQKTPATA